jgi:hypothetical protein
LNKSATIKNAIAKIARIKIRENFIGAINQPWVAKITVKRTSKIVAKRSHFPG